MSKNILIALGVIALLVMVVLTAMFGTGLIEVVSVDEAYQRQEQEKEMIAELGEAKQIAMNRQVGSMNLEDAVEMTRAEVVSIADLDKIRILIEREEYQKALEAHLWFHEKSKSSPAMTGVRLSFALSSWMELGKEYSPALDALKGLRDENEIHLLSGSGGFTNFHDFFAINKTLGSDQATLDLFLVLNKQKPEQSGTYYHIVENLLIEAKQYDIVRKFIGDPVVKYENLRFLRETSLSHAKSSEGDHVSFLLESADQQFIKGVLALIGVCIAIDNKSAAKEVQQRALSYFDNDEIRDVFETS